MPCPELNDLWELMLYFSKYGGIPPSEFWGLTHRERVAICEKLNTWRKEEAKNANKRDEACLKALGKMLASLFRAR